MENTKYNVRLTDDTTGTIDVSSIDFQNPENFIGEIVRIQLVDENGNPIEKEGELAEIL